MPNKAQFIELLAERFEGDKKRAAAALDAVIETVYANVAKGEKVALTGFGIFEKRERAARIARNPATGARVQVKKTSVPAFRAGAEFKAITSGAKKLAKAPARGAAKVAPAKKAPAPRPLPPRRLRPRRRAGEDRGRQGAGQEGCRQDGGPPKAPAKKAAGQEGARQEGSGQEGARQEGSGQEGRALDRDRQTTAPVAGTVAGAFAVTLGRRRGGSAFVVVGGDDVCRRPAKPSTQTRALARVGVRRRAARSAVDAAPGSRRPGCRRRITCPTAASSADRARARSGSAA